MFMIHYYLINILTSKCNQRNITYTHNLFIYSWQPFNLLYINIKQILKRQKHYLVLNNTLIIIKWPKSVRYFELLNNITKYNIAINITRKFILFHGNVTLTYITSLKIFINNYKSLLLLLFYICCCKKKYIITNINGKIFQKAKNIT